MEIRKTKMSDLEEILKIYEHARQYMCENHNPHQWKTTNPTYEQVIDDINKELSYVCCERGIILGVFYFNIGIDPTYNIIDGQWINNKEYGVVHRIAVKVNQKGVGSFCLNYAYEKCHNLKIDTHVDNLPMRSLLEKLGFKYCGIIKLLNGEERLAYQKE